MKKFKKWWILIPLGLVIFGLTVGGLVLIWALIRITPELCLPTVTLDSGKTYYYFPEAEYPVDDCPKNGLNLLNTSLQQLQDNLDDCMLPDMVIGPISTEDKAAYYGTTVLNEAFEIWTMSDCVRVHYLETANAWIVHGMLDNRDGDDDKIGLVAFDAATGKILGVIAPKTQSGTDLAHGQETCIPQSPT